MVVDSSPFPAHEEIRKAIHKTLLLKFFFSEILFKIALNIPRIIFFERFHLELNVCKQFDAQYSWSIHRDTSGEKRKCSEGFQSRGTRMEEKKANGQHLVKSNTSPPPCAPFCGISFSVPVLRVPPLHLGIPLHWPKNLCLKKPFGSPSSGLTPATNVLVGSPGLRKFQIPSNEYANEYERK